MVDIVLRDLTDAEVKELRVLKAQLDKKNWRSLIIEIVREWKKSRTRITQVLK